MPRITISINAPNEPSDQELITLDLPQDLSVADLKGFVQAETNFPPEVQHFYLNGQALRNDSQTLGEVGIRDGEMLAMLVRRPEAEGSRAQVQRRAGGNTNRNQQDRQPTADEIETIRLRILGNPESVADLISKNADLAGALHDSARFKDIWMTLHQEELARRQERDRQIALLNEDPFNVEAQKKIEDMIRHNNVMENAQHAYENNPEVFVRVTMLYINTIINGHPVKAFVDSGAQATIMSPSCAERCGIMRLIDTRYSGIAKGVGTAKILGRVHSAVIKIGDVEMDCAFTVMEGKDVELLFGLDNLKRFQACIDLKDNTLKFQGQSIPFLHENDIPTYVEEQQASEPTIPGPNGTEIGAQSGAVKASGSQSIGVAPSQAPAAAAGASAAPGSSAASSSRPPQQAQQQQQQQQQTQPAAPAQGRRHHPENDIQSLQSLGMSREEAISALDACDGNVDYAAALLFNN